MKRVRRCLGGLLVLLVVAAGQGASADQAALDLPVLAGKVRPAVMLMVKSDTSRDEVPAGTGFLVSSDGLLVTNHHVIQSTQRVKAKAENGQLFPVTRVLAVDEKTDLAVLKIDEVGLPWLPLGDGAGTEPGASLAVIGSALTPEDTLSGGRVSAVCNLPGRRTRVLQISAAVSRNLIGAPVLDAEGRVIGVAASLVREGRSLNFAVPVTHAKALVAKAEKARKARPSASSPQASSSKREGPPPNWLAVENGRPESKGQRASSSSYLGKWRFRARDLFGH